MKYKRLEQLLEFLENEPNEAFNIYAVGLEYLKIEPKQALIYFEKLLKEHPDYVPTYYQAGKLYEDLEINEKALNVYTKGIEIAAQNKDNLALRELRNAHQQLLDDLADE